MYKPSGNKVIDLMADFMTARFYGAQTLRNIINLTMIFSLANILTGFSHKDNPILLVMAIINLFAFSIYTGAYLGYR